MATVALGRNDPPSRAGRASVCFGQGLRVHEEGFDLAWLRPELPEDAVEPHIHDEAHFVLVTEGDYISSAAGAPPVTAAPLLVFNPPGTVHRDRFRGDGRFLALSLPSGLVGLPDLPVCLGAGPQRAAHRLARALVAESQSDLTGHCWELVAAVRPPDGTGVPGWLRRARQMIEDSHAPGPRLIDIAREVGVHPVHLARVFRSALGCAPSEYRDFARLRRARALISATDTSIAEIAHATGFADQSHLTRNFSRRFGITPGALRAALGNVAKDQSRRRESG